MNNSKETIICPCGKIFIAYKCNKRKYCSLQCVALFIHDLQKRDELTINYLKHCSVCGKIKELNNFNKDKTQYDGFAKSCKECRSLTTKKYRDNNKEKIKQQQKNWYLTNKDHIRIYESNKFETDINYKLAKLLRGRVRDALKRNIKTINTLSLIGCSIEELKSHLEKQFVKGMTWNNHGRGCNGAKEWHIDHIRPCASFDLSKPEEQRKCFHYSNLQPLWAEDNFKKGSKY